MSDLHKLVALAAFALLLLAGPRAIAQNSIQSPPPSATKEGGVEGDPTGAIRALGGTGTSDAQDRKTVVTVPKLGARDGGASRTGGVPEGTTGGANIR